MLVTWCQDGEFCQQNVPSRDDAEQLEHNLLQNESVTEISFPKEN